MLYALSGSFSSFLINSLLPIKKIKKEFNSIDAAAAPVREPFFRGGSGNCFEPDEWKEISRPRWFHLCFLPTLLGCSQARGSKLHSGISQARFHQMIP
jgi:hypothetical protein